KKREKNKKLEKNKMRWKNGERMIKWKWEVRGGEKRGKNEGEKSGRGGKRGEEDKNKEGNDGKTRGKEI
ncbi:UNVERIFIED_CONTAM: hypothetical protein DVV56_10605, partial [Lactobacillus acidophilus]|nr:hypothetical protein [Lactobacillus acidophilus]